MAASLEAAGILEPWAETLHEQVLEVAELNHRAGMTASEAESEARKDLLPCSWEAQEEWLATTAVDYEPMVDPDLYHPDQEDEEIDESAPEGIPLLRSRFGELELVREKLTHAIRSAMRKRELPPEVIMELAGVLCLVTRLPEHHEDFTGKLDLTRDFGDGAGWKSVTIDEGGLSLETGEIIRGSYGTDHTSKVVFQATRQGSSGLDCDFDLEDWLYGFIADAQDPNVEMTLEWYPDMEIPGRG